MFCFKFWETYPIIRISRWKVVNFLEHAVLWKAHLIKIKKLKVAISFLLHKERLLKRTIWIVRSISFSRMQTKENKIFKERYVIVISCTHFYSQARITRDLISLPVNLFYLWRLFKTHVLHCARFHWIEAGLMQSNRDALHQMCGRQSRDVRFQ